MNRYSDRSESEQVGTRTVSHSPGGGGGGLLGLTFAGYVPLVYYSLFCGQI